MNRKIFLLFLVCLVVVLVKSESTIEVDENGDEYVVKRFNIQGRQLNGGRSQCVVTRRKRAAQPTPVYSDGGSNDEVDVSDGGDTIKGVEQQALFNFSPTSVSPTTGDEEEEEEKEEEENEEKEEEDSNKNEGGIHKKEDEETLNNAEKSNNNNSEENKEMEEENEDNNEEDNSDTIKIIRFPQVPVSSQSDTESIAAIGLTSGIIHVENQQAIAGSDDGIVVVQSHTPPKVNPQTHAVFELVPVNHAGAPEDEENEDDVEDDFDFMEELSPITTTAIWSTGDDVSNDFNDVSTEKPQKIVKKIKKPVKAQKNKKRTSLKPKRKNKYKDSFQHRPASSNKKRLNKNKNKNKGRPYRTGVSRPNKRRKLRPGHNVRPRPYPQKNKNSYNSFSSNKNRGSNSNKTKLGAKRRNKKGNAENLNQGVNTYTRTMTMTQTGNEDDDKNVNCIIIRQDPPPTTARPFWNILGRSASGAPQASGHFGKRKRVNVRFVA